MTKKVKLLIVSISVFLLAVVLGCSAFQDVVTPCYIDKDCAVYANTSSTMFTPYTSLFDAKRIKARMEYIKAAGILKYSYLMDSMDYHMENSEEFKSSVFNPTGPIGGLLFALPSFGLGALLVSKPEDKKKITELEKNGTPKSPSV